MKIAYSTLACPDWTLEQCVENAKRYGYDGLELRLLDGKLLEPKSMDQATLDRVRSVCLNAGLPIVCVDTSVKIAQLDPLERLKQLNDGMAFLEIAASWGSPFIRVFPGPPKDSVMAEAVAAAVDSLSLLASRGASLGVTVGLETHDAFAGPAVAAVLQQVPGPGAGALWDVLNTYSAGESLADSMKLLGDRLIHTHIKDGQPKEGVKNWAYTLLGEGKLPAKNLLKLLRDADYKGWLSVEWEKKWHPEIADPELALPQYAKLLRKYLSEL